MFGGLSVKWPDQRRRASVPEGTEQEDIGVGVDWVIGKRMSSYSPLPSCSSMGRSSRTT